MISLYPATAVRVLQGMIRDLDLMARGLLLAAGEELIEVDVPADCPIVLHGERVKFRLLQEADRVTVTMACEDSRAVAKSIEVKVVSRRQGCGIPAVAVLG